MNAPSILIVEDDLLIAEHLKTLLTKEGIVNINIAINYAEAISFIKNNNTDLVLLDVNLSNGKTGIDIAETINQWGVGFIFITAQSEQPIVERIIKTKPLGYILKPFSGIQVTTAVKIALQQVLQKTIELFDGKKSYRMISDNILYLKAEGNYVDVVTEKQTITLRNSLKKILPSLPKVDFYLANRSYIVNKKHIYKSTPKAVFIKDVEINVTKE
ncbi:MAG: LytR/AlgR family response regulator transcription factor [Bacteroidia bacterium]